MQLNLPSTLPRLLVRVLVRLLPTSRLRPRGEAFEACGHARTESILMPPLPSVERPVPRSPGMSVH